MSSPCIDLHCHSTASDGRLSPEQLVELAVSTGLRALALTDHDTVAGLERFAQAGRAAGLETVPGVEISAQYERGTMHLVGLFVDASNPAFRAFLQQLADGRNLRNPQIVARLCELGLPLSMAEVEQEAGLEGSGFGGGALDKSVGRPHIAAVMIKKGYVKDKREAFDRFLAKGQPCYVSRFVATPEESIAQIHRAGGLAILAHPAYLNATGDEEQEQIVQGLKQAGLDGLEVYYSTHSPEQTTRYARLAQRCGLAVSGGSDFHGETLGGGGRDGRAVMLGSGFGGNIRIPYQVLEDLRDLKERKRLREIPSVQSFRCSVENPSPLPASGEGSGVGLPGGE